MSMISKLSQAVSSWDNGSCVAVMSRVTMMMPMTTTTIQRRLWYLLS